MYNTQKYYFFHIVALFYHLFIYLFNIMSNVMTDKNLVQPANISDEIDFNLEVPPFGKSQVIYYYLYMHNGIDS